MELNLDSFTERTEPLGILGLVVTQNGEETAKRLWDKEIRRNVYSIAKSFTACAVGLAQNEGLLSVDEKLCEAFAEELPCKVSENLAAATIADALSMRMGQGNNFLTGDKRPLYEEDNWVRLTLAQPFDYPPKTKFVYNNAGPYLAGVLVQRRAGMSLTEYLTPRLFKPLGIKNPLWETDPLGYNFGSSGLMLTLSEYHRLGLLFLGGGEWQGAQLLPREWVRECTRDLSGNGYGCGFWCGKHGSFYADGKYQQLSVVFPDKNAVVSTSAECRRSGAILKAIYEEIYPQI